MIVIYIIIFAYYHHFYTVFLVNAGRYTNKHTQSHAGEERYVAASRASSSISSVSLTEHAIWLLSFFVTDVKEQGYPTKVPESVRNI